MLRIYALKQRLCGFNFPVIPEKVKYSGHDIAIIVQGNQLIESLIRKFLTKSGYTLLGSLFIHF